MKNRQWCGMILVAVAALAANAPAQAASPAAKDSTVVARLNADAKLAGWWKFDETTGQTAADSSGKNRPGELQGGVAFESHSADGRLGKALRFEGKGLVRIKGYKGVTGTEQRTLSAWIKTTTTEGDIVAWGSDAPGKMWRFGFVRGGVGVTPKGGYLYMRPGTQDGKWHHVVVVVREAAPPNLHDDVKLFKDGEPAEIDDIGLLDLWPIDTGDAQEVVIGQRFKGLIDDLRIYERALADEEVKALFKAANQ